MITTVSANTKFLGNKPQTTAGIQPSFGDRGSFTKATSEKIFAEHKSTLIADYKKGFLSLHQLLKYLLNLKNTLYRLVNGIKDKKMPPYNK